MTAIAEIRTAPTAMPRLVADLREAFATGRTKSLTWRRDQLRRMAEMLVKERDAICRALEADLGKPSFEGWLAEIALVEKEIELALKKLGDWVRPEKVSIPIAIQPGHAYIEHDPLGVVLIIAPWNYPFQLAILPLMSAIAAGNCAIVKPSEVSANTSKLIGQLVPRYLDATCIRVVEGGVPETTALLEQKFDHILYTGNGQVARVVMAAAAKHLTPVTLELGGKSPTVVDETADLDVAARRIAMGKFFNAGQTCVAPDYVLVHRAVEERLVQKLKDVIGQFFGPDPKASGDYARIINERHHRRLVGYLADGTVAHGGQHDEATKYIAPTLLRKVSPTAKVMQDEIFGPILPIIPVDTVDEAIRFINERDKPLALYYFTEDKARARRMMRETSSGGACINDAIMHLTCPTLPFGGVGESGMGNYHGKFGFDTFSHKKAVLHKSNKLDAPLRYPPFDDTKAKWLKRLM